MQCNVELLDDCIKHLKRGTAAGLGELTVEHLLYVLLFHCHYCLLCWFCMVLWHLSLVKVS